MSMMSHCLLLEEQDTHRRPEHVLPQAGGVRPAGSRCSMSWPLMP
jgi:hypothetical protein